MNNYRRLARLPGRSFFLFGMRGVGKSTWVRQELPRAPVVDLLDGRLYLDLAADPSLFGQMLAECGAGDWVVVDEVQRLPSLLNEVHRLIEGRSLRFALLGSSARKLKSAGTNLLAGRAVRRTMYPFTAAELGGDFDLERVLRFGSIPLVWASEEPRDVLEAYVDLYLREEIRAEALVRNFPGFVRFLPVAALLNTQAVNVAGIARDAGVARTTVQGYLDILEDTLLTWRLPAWESRTKVRERRHPKLYWLDPGLVRAVKRQLGEVAAEERGPLLETWVGTTLKAHDESSQLFDELCYWAPHGANTEVDFVLRRGRELLGIEVKATARYHTRLLRGLRSFGEAARRVLVYGGDRSFRTEDGIDVWPARRFAEAAATGRLWP